MDKKRLAIISTHPIQYNAPFFKKLTRDGKIECKVFYTFNPALKANYDREFGQAIKWDIPLMEGYDYEFVENVSKDPGSHHFLGVRNPSLNKRVAAFQPDAVLIYGWAWYSHLAAMIYFKGKIPVFFRGDSHLLDKKSWGVRLLRKLLLKNVYRFVDKAFYVGTHNKNYYLEFGLKPEQLIYAPHSVDNDFWMQADDSPKDYRQDLGLDGNAKVLLYVGKLNEGKNYKLLIEAFCTINQANWHLWIVGSGQKSEMFIGTKDAHARIHFWGFLNQNELRQLYKQVDCLVVPSKSETWGLVMNEAMCCSVPVIASDKVGGAVDLIEEGVNGAIFKSENVDDLMLKLKQLNNSQEASKINARHKVSSFNYQVYCDAIYNNL